jgi:hypothetical protein
MSKQFNKILILLAIIVLLVLIAVIVDNFNKERNLGPAAIDTGISSSPTASPTASPPPEGAPLDNFAKCLAEKGVKFYGAYWCGHCQNQKEMFGEAVQYVNYIECWDSKTNKMIETCATAKIEAFPTWDFPAGQRELGKMSLERLSELSGCPLK